MACIHPQVHLNGSNRGNLIADRAQQWQAVKSLIEVLSTTAPHSRDFYHVPFDWDQAYAEHERRMIMLQELLEDITIEYDSLVQGAHNGQ